MVETKTDTTATACVFGVCDCYVDCSHTVGSEYSYMWFSSTDE